MNKLIVETNGLSAEEQLTLPWWDPRNDQWWLTASCFPTNLDPDSRWVLGLL